MWIPAVPKPRCIQDLVQVLPLPNTLDELKTTLYRVFLYITEWQPMHRAHTQFEVFVQTLAIQVRNTTIFQQTNSIMRMKKSTNINWAIMAVLARFLAIPFLSKSARPIKFYCQYVVFLLSIKSLYRLNIVLMDAVRPNNDTLNICEHYIQNM